MFEASNNDNVRSVTNKIVYKLDQVLGTASGKAMLASLRNSIGKPLSHSVDLWPLVFESFPAHFLSYSHSESKEEVAILTSLQLYGLYRQGITTIVSDEDNDRYVRNLGYSLRPLRSGDNSIAMDRRFNALITASTFEEFVHHSRQMIKILKSKTSGLRYVDFARLANDYYRFLRGNEENVRLQWARAYYRNSPNGGKTNDKS